MNWQFFHPVDGDGSYDYTAMILDERCSQVLDEETTKHDPIREWGEVPTTAPLVFTTRDSLPIWTPGRWIVVVNSDDVVLEDPGKFLKQLCTQLRAETPIMVTFEGRHGERRVRLMTDGFFAERVLPRDDGLD